MTQVWRISHTAFVTTTRGLNRDLLPMRLYEKAKRLGIRIEQSFVLRRNFFQLLKIVL